VSSLTDYLRRDSSGDRAAGEVAFLRAFPRLCRIAAVFLRRRRDRSVFSPGELVNVVWLRDFCKGGWPVHNSEHFFAMAGRSGSRAWKSRVRFMIRLLFFASLDQIGIGNKRRISIWNRPLSMWNAA